MAAFKTLDENLKQMTATPERRYQTLDRSPEPSEEKNHISRGPRNMVSRSVVGPLSKIQKANNIIYADSSSPDKDVLTACQDHYPLTFMSTRNKFGSYQKVNDFRLALPKHQRRRLIGLRNGNESITLSQEGSGSRDPMRDTQMKVTSSAIFKKGKIDWKNFDVNAENSFDSIDSPRGQGLVKRNSMVNKLRQSLLARNKLDKLEGMNPLDAYNTIDGGA